MFVLSAVFYVYVCKDRLVMVIDLVINYSDSGSII